MNTVFFMKIMLLKPNSSSPTKLVNFLILVTFKILDFKGHKYEEIDYFSWWWAVVSQ